MFDRASTEEVEHCNQVARDHAHREEVLQRLKKFSRLYGNWGEPTVDSWLDSVYDCAAQADVFDHLAPAVVNGTVVQFGGSGIAALKALIGGAASATLVTPAVSEADFAGQLAVELGCAERFKAVVAFAEDSKLPSESATAIISEACLHHMSVPEALREADRILQPGGRFGSWDPWRARLYGMGVAMFGKRDQNVNCTPLEMTRIDDFARIFPDSTVRLHGAITRYPAIAAGKVGIRLGLPAMRRLTRIDDSLSSRIEMLKRNGSSVAMLGLKK